MTDSTKRLLLLGLSLLSAIIFSFAATRMTSSVEDALILMFLFLFEGGVYGAWNESIGVARYQMRQKEDRR